MTSQPNVSPRSRWQAVCDHLDEYFYKPDHQALAVALSAYAVHWYFDRDPVWLFVVGPSGSGKTSIIARALTALPNVTAIADLTPHTFISALPKTKGGSSLLLNLSPLPGGGTHGVLVFKDFTSILCARAESRREIIAQMRHISDGDYPPGKGVRVDNWRGKVTAIAAVTPAIERAWAFQRDMGERFLTIRWPRRGGAEIARAAARQSRRQAGEFVELIRQFVEPATLNPGVELADDDMFGHLAEYVAVLRTLIHRDGSQHIDEQPWPEEPTRIAQTMTSVALGHAMLHRRKAVNFEDVALARRIGFDSVPLIRLRVLATISQQTSQSEIKRETGLPTTAIIRTCEDLEALGVIERDKAGDYTVMDKFAELRLGALGESANVVRFPVG